MLTKSRSQRAAAGFNDCAHPFSSMIRERTYTSPAPGAAASAATSLSTIRGSHESSALANSRYFPEASLAPSFHRGYTDPERVS